MDEKEATPETEPSTDAAIDDVGDLAATLFPDEPEEGAEAGKAKPASETPAESEQPDGEGDEPAKTDSQPRYKVKVNGQEIEVAQDELLKGYSRLEDYKQKTAKLAEQERSLERTVQERIAKETAQDRQNLRSAIAHYVQLIQGGLDPEIAKGMKTDWEAHVRADPVNGPADHLRFQRKLAEFQQARNQLAQATEEQTRQAENERLQHVAESHKKLIEVMPDWGDDAKRAEIQAKFRPIFNSLGYSDQEIDGMTDWRVFPALKEIAEYRDWKANIAKAKKQQVKEATKVAAPKASKDGPTQSARLAALSKKADSGRPDDIAAYAEALYGA